MRMADSERASEKHDLLGDLFEATLKFLSVVTCMEAIRANGGVPEPLRQPLKAMLHPSLGMWADLLRQSLRELGKKSLLGSVLNEQYHAKLPEEIASAYSQLAEVIHYKGTVGRPKTKDALDLFVTYRNKVWKGHGAKITHAEYETRVGMILPVMRHILAQLEGMQDFELLNVDSIQVAQDQSFIHKITKCTGTQVEPGGLKLESALTPETAYFVERGSEGALFNPVPLAPFFLLRPCQDCKTPQPFFFNGVKGKHIEYLSYHCGHFHFPDTLAQDFEELLDVSIKVHDVAEPKFGTPGGGDEESHISYTTQGDQDMAARNVEDALRSYQVALMYKETADAHHKAALAALCAGNATAGIMHIRAAIDIADLVVFAEILDEVLGVTGGKDPDKIGPGQEAAIMRIGERYANIEDETVPRPITLFDRITPKRFEKKPFMFSGGLVAVAWIVRIILSRILSYPLEGIILFMMIGSFCGVLFTFLMCRFFQNSYYPLLNQVSERARGRFPSWFRETISKSFGLAGPESATNGSIVAGIRLRKEFVILMGFLVFAAFFSVLRSDGAQNPVAAFFFLYDAAVFMIPTAYPVAVAVFSFLSIIDYSGLSLKPKLDRVSGMRLESITNGLFAARLVVGVYFLCAVISGPHYTPEAGRVVFLILASSMVVMASAWTLGIPIALYAALARAKGRVAADYSRHIERAFRDFLKDPLGGSSKRLDDLTKESRRVRLISVNPMGFSGWMQTIFFLVLYWTLGLLFLSFSGVSFTGIFTHFPDLLLSIFG